MSDRDDPRLRAIADEARRRPGGVLIATGHLGWVLGHPVDGPEGVALLIEFAESHGLDVTHDTRDGLLFTAAPSPPSPPED